ncbi:hypothetical protein ZEAMMB73_Zm00001d040037 [Zea mays]|uniref:Protein kinase domain-containing protein n=1 Tax=Zea mays TaxID=4577 RepID=A0A1D6MMD7_MAIZE|nr:hypothetical protein ZEAMMB73_Zm00001d040037 [Zea mays]
MAWWRWSSSCLTAPSHPPPRRRPHALMLSPLQPLGMAAAAALAMSHVASPSLFAPASSTTLDLPPYSSSCFFQVPRADIWLFGITALELAIGHAPFSIQPPAKVFLMTLQHAPP